MSKLVRESLSDKLKGPSKKEILDKVRQKRDLSTNFIEYLVKNKKYDIIKQLLEEKIMIQDNLNYALHVTPILGDFKMFNFLINQGAIKEELGDMLFNSLLHNNIKIFKHIFRKIDPENILKINDIYQLAIGKENIEIIRLLIRKGTPLPYDALKRAIETNNLEIVKLIDQAAGGYPPSDIRAAVHEVKQIDPEIKNYLINLIRKYE